MNRCREVALQLNWQKYVNLYSILHWKELVEEGEGEGREGGGSARRVRRRVWLRTRFPMSRAVCPRRPLGQPVVRGSVLVVGRGRARRTSRVVRVMWRRAAVAMVAVVPTAGVPVVVGAAVIPLTAWVVPLSLESAPVALENLGGELQRIIYISGADLWTIRFLYRLKFLCKAFQADLFGWWGAVFNGGALGHRGRRRSFQQARASDGGGRGATTGAIWVACAWMVNWKNNKEEHDKHCSLGSDKTNNTPQRVC